MSKISSEAAINDFVTCVTRIIVALPPLPTANSPWLGLRRGPQIEFTIEPPCKAEKEHKDKDGKDGGAILVKGRDITDLDGLGAGCLHLDGVGVDNLLFTPFGVPFLQINGVGTNADKDAIVQVDAVALDVVGEVVGCGVRNGLHRVTGIKQKHSQEHCAQTDNDPCR